jgi:hypothetical protein
MKRYQKKREPERALVSHAAPPIYLVLVRCSGLVLPPMGAPVAGFTSFVPLGV